MRKKKAELIEEIKSLQSENKMLHQRVYELAKLAEEVYRLRDENRRFKAYNEKLVKDLATATGQLERSQKINQQQKLHRTTLVFQIQDIWSNRRYSCYSSCSCPTHAHCWSI